jgi:hypothetical protein
VLHAGRGVFAVSAAAGDRARQSGARSPLEVHAPAAAAGVAGVVVNGERQPWDRRDGETSKGYAAFRQFRDQGPLRTLGDVPGSHITISRWSSRWDWSARATAWDDAAHMADDARRLEAIRTMHDTHQRAGRAAMGKALAALQRMEPEDIPPYAIAKLLELGARLERDTLIVSVEELQGVFPAHLPQMAAPVDDPWERISRALTNPDSA